MPPRSPVPQALRAVAAQQESLVCTRQCLDAGIGPNVLTRLVRSGSWARITAGVYDLDPTPPPTRPPDSRRRRAAWAALLAFGPEAIAVGPCALALLGVAGLPSRVVPQATLPGARGLESRDGIRLRMFDDGMTVVRVGDRYVAAPEWALAQAVPELDRPWAVSVMDSALHLGLVSTEGLDRAHDHARGRRGVARTHSWWELADCRAESPLETWVRLDCLDGGVPPDTLQVPLVGSSGRERRGDLGWLLDDGRWVVAEADGAEFHDTPSAAFADRERHNDLVTADVAAVLRFTSADTRVPGRAATTVRRALLSTGRRRAA
ncbi:type IV toxin-antitoxin system AbiEi family antitoxin domain-containing protein [Cellulosimicrobium sp. SH8]|uniref:type IV toxin-antitoxin system AbiEi family antitoxin domain-containing protein n=1 Tax=Cellulosimicrobium sp. SH8 TaxID=2952936 RepID=UPI0021F3629A|nr:type IV toxin-antitoxin system AbiEi family antitoxin domain-containing protein [Cellulosimicrobium sp. SH8]